MYTKAGRYPKKKNTSILHHTKPNTQTEQLSTRPLNCTPPKKISMKDAIYPGKTSFCQKYNMLKNKKVDMKHQFPHSQCISCFSVAKRSTISNWLDRNYWKHLSFYAITFLQGLKCIFEETLRSKSTFKPFLNALSYLFLPITSISN